MLRRLCEWWNKGKRRCPKCDVNMHERPDGTFWCRKCHVIKTLEEFTGEEPYNV